MASHHKEMSKTKDMEKIMVTAVVVTYNRKALLEKVIRSLLAQTVEIGRIIIVNNGPTDGTGEWLAAEYGNDPRFDVVTQENVGGSGGFYRGIQEASKEKCDWIWCMDDDVFPRENCLETLLNVAQRHAYSSGGGKQRDGEHCRNGFRRPAHPQYCLLRS